LNAAVGTDAAIDQLLGFGVRYNKTAFFECGFTASREESNQDSRWSSTRQKAGSTNSTTGGKADKKETEEQGEKPDAAAKPADGTRTEPESVTETEQENVNARMIDGSVNILVVLVY